MKQLGSLEEEVLLITMATEAAYGVGVAEEYCKQTGKRISIPAVHTVLRRLEEKGLLASHLGDSSPERGGRRKRLYKATAFGFRVIKDIKAERIRLWSNIPELKWHRNA